MSENWNRSCQLIVGIKDAEIDAIDFSNLRIAFEVRQAMTGQPAIAEVFIYNLSNETMNKFKGDDGNFTTGQDFALYAGYEGNTGLIFQGSVFQFRRGRESPTDTYLCIIAQNADIPHNFSVMKGNLAAGRNFEQEKQEIFKSMKANGAQCGYLAPAANQNEAPRGKTFCGATMDYAKEHADNNNQDLAYDNTGAITLVERNPRVDYKAYVLNTTTGLTGMPQLTESGLSAECLLNPKLRLGDQVQINESLVQSQNYDTGYGQQGRDQPFKQAFGADGYYKIVGISHAGDTRGDTWQTSIVALGIGATQAITGVAVNGVQNAV